MSSVNHTPSPSTNVTRVNGYVGSNVLCRTVLTL
jgi:hypothetical protein